MKNIAVKTFGTKRFARLTTIEKNIVSRIYKIKQTLDKKEEIDKS